MCFLCYAVSAMNATAQIQHDLSQFGFIAAIYLLNVTGVTCPQY
jgi:hypothetical protein